MYFLYIPTFHVILNDRPMAEIDSPLVKFQRRVRNMKLETKKFTLGRLINTSRNSEFAPFRELTYRDRNSRT